ncbi:MAG: hypothetical protein HOO91_04790 [Bacteroidales bacterium]|nr:hypothetical protein [Bacteroidales bacterium]
MQNIKNYNEINEDVSFQKGVRVEIIEGSFKGLTGEMVKSNGKNKIIVEIEAIKQSISIELNSSYIRIQENDKLLSLTEGQDIEAKKKQLVSILPFIIFCSNTFDELFYLTTVILNL